MHLGPGQAAHGDAGAPGTLAVLRSGPTPPAPGATPLVAAHGFTQHAGTWGPLLADLAADRPVAAVDLPGHGGSAAVDADLWGTASLLAAAGGHGDYLGYSLGGRVCLHLALAHPEVVRRLVLVGATAGIRDPAARLARRAADAALAERLASRPLASFLQDWLAQPLFRTLAPADAAVEARLANTPAGLAASLRSCGTGNQQPLWDRLGELRMPVLLVAGALDVRFTAAAVAMARAIGANAAVAIVPGAGHACQLERPAHVARLVRSFLA